MKIRATTKQDLNQLIELHQAASQTPDGIARKALEVTAQYVENFLNNSLQNGLSFVCENSDKKIVASIHCYRFEPECFKHCLGNLVIVVHPNFQNQGLGRKIFSHLLNDVSQNHHNIARVELFVRQTNLRGLALYEKLGFKVEGICKNRLLDSQGKMSDDTMMAWFNPNFIKN